MGWSIQGMSKMAELRAYYYQVGEIQDVADIVGDSLALAQWAFQ